MHRQKIRSSVTRRFKVTKNGKILARRSFRRHLKASKSKKRLRNLKRVKEIKGYYAKKLKKAMGVRKAKVIRKESKQTVA